MAKTNFQIFNEENAPERTYNDSEYKEATQRLGGVMPGMALSRMHNKMYYQWSAMCKAIANLIVKHGHDCMDNDVSGITQNLEEAITNGATEGIKTHRTAAELDHPDGSVTTNKIADDAVTSDKIANSVELRGVPKAPTAEQGSNNTQIATTAFVVAALSVFSEELKKVKTSVSILTGTIAHGGTIPLPEGYTEDQCKWMVSIRSDNPGNREWDPNENAIGLFYKFDCYTTGRVVYCASFHLTEGGMESVTGTANYIIIGVK